MADNFAHLAHSVTEGVVWGAHHGSTTGKSFPASVLIQTGLTPKMVRFPTKKNWGTNEIVRVVVLSEDEYQEIFGEHLLTVEGSIDD